MKKNTFKTRPEDIKYEPIKQPKQPFWMHSIDRPVPRNEMNNIVGSFLVLLAFLVFIIILTVIICPK